MSMQEPSPSRRVPRPALTARAAVLAVVVVFVLGTVALPVRDLVAQRNRINALRDRAAIAQEELRAMNADIAQWNDPAFVAVQARARLHFVMPGEVGYVVIEADDAQTPQAKRPARERSMSWYTALWGGIQAAGRTAAPSH